MSVGRSQSLTVKGRILVVDDDVAVRAMLADHLSAQGYAVVMAADGPAAFASVRAGRPDLVLLDIGLPGINGLEVLRQIRLYDQRIGVIMITGNQDLALARSTRELGALDYVFKPFELGRIDRAITTTMGMLKLFG